MNNKEKYFLTKVSNRSNQPVTGKGAWKRMFPSRGRGVTNSGYDPTDKAALRRFEQAKKNRFNPGGRPMPHPATSKDMTARITEPGPSRPGMTRPNQPANLEPLPPPNSQLAFNVESPGVFKPSKPK